MKSDSEESITCHDSLGNSKSLIQAKAENLSALFRNSSPTFLLGAGCSISAGIPLTRELDQAVLEDSCTSESTKSLLRNVRDRFASDEEAGTAHIEDYLSELIDLKAIVSRRTLKNSTAADIDLGGQSFGEPAISSAIAEITSSIARAVDIDLSEDRLDLHRRFVRAAHHEVRDGRDEQARQMNYMVLNYDTLVETALGLERIRYADGMRGGPTGWWDIATLDSPGTHARVFKLHGSVDWVLWENDDFRFPRRLPTSIARSVSSGRAMIWPAETKYRETRFDPFAQLSERAWNRLRQDQPTPPLLVVCGYSFGDAHINHEIERSLDQVPSLTLAVLLGNSRPSCAPVLAEWCNTERYSERILVYAKQGYFHGMDSIEASTDLDWWTFESLVRLLEMT